MRFFKTMLFTGVLTAFLVVSGFNAAHATGKKCPPGQYAKGWKCFPIEGGGDGDITINNNNNPKAYGGSVNIGNGLGNKVLSPSAKATAVAGAIGIFDVDNEIDMDQKQNQKQNQKQSQDQLQIQGQIGINKQGQTAHNEGVKQKVKVVVEGDNFEAPITHIQPVAGANADAETKRSYGHDSKTFGSVMDVVDGMYADAAKKLGSGSSDVVLEVAIFFEPKNAVNYIRFSDDGEFSGFIYAECDGRDCTAAGMEGKAADKAAALGYTSITRDHKSKGEDLKGSDFSLRVGGGASVATHGGKTVIAPGGGIGGGWAHSDSQWLPAMTFRVYYNPLFIKVD